MNYKIDKFKDEIKKDGSSYIEKELSENMIPSIMDSVDKFLEEKNRDNFSSANDF
jgi:hypothetical protein